MKVYIEKKVSTKTKNEYIGLYVNTGSKKVLVTMETNVILELGDLRPSELCNLKVDTPFVLGTITK